jgi:hypothetical protein
MRLIALCLLCFTVQNALASAHFHLANAQTAAHVTGEAWKADPGKRAGSGEPAGCPLCQFLILGSAALHSYIAALLAPVESASFVVADQTFARFVSAVSWSWQGRGPPHI